MCIRSFGEVNTQHFARAHPDEVKISSEAALLATNGHQPSPELILYDPVLFEFCSISESWLTRRI
jgi:hypothetical protein